MSQEKGNEDDNVADDFLTTDQVAGALQVTRETVRRWCRDGRLPARKIAGGAYLIRPSDIEGRIPKSANDGMAEVADEPDKVLTVKQTAEFLQVSEETVRRWLRKNKIRYVCIGGTHRIPRGALLGEIEAWVLPADRDRYRALGAALRSGVTPEQIADADGYTLEQVVEMMERAKRVPPEVAATATALREARDKRLRRDFIERTKKQVASKPYGPKEFRIRAGDWSQESIDALAQLAGKNMHIERPQQDATP